MIKRIQLEDVRKLIDEGAQLVDVLPEAEYQEEHLPGAIHLPLKQLNAETASRLTKERAIIVYCYDYQ